MNEKLNFLSSMISYIFRNPHKKSIIQKKLRIRRSNQQLPFSTSNTLKPLYVLEREKKKKENEETHCVISYLLFAKTKKFKKILNLNFLRISERREQRVRERERERVEIFIFLINSYCTHCHKKLNSEADFHIL